METAGILPNLGKRLLQGCFVPKALEFHLRNLWLDNKVIGAGAKFSHGGASPGCCLRWVSSATGRRWSGCNRLRNWLGLTGPNTNLGGVVQGINKGLLVNFDLGKGIARPPQQILILIELIWYLTVQLIVVVEVEENKDEFWLWNVLRCARSF